MTDCLQGGLKTALYILALFVTSAGAAAAQNLVIVNARVIDGKGGVMERGSVAVRDGKIVSISVSAPAASTGRHRSCIFLAGLRLCRRASGW